jgi:peroxiredoxin
VPIILASLAWSRLLVAEGNRMQSLHTQWPLDVGDQVTPMTLTTRKGDTIALPPEDDDYLLLAFVRGDWCPVCQVQMRIYGREAPHFAERGIRLVVVSRDGGPEAAALADYLGIACDIAVDADLEVAKAFGAVDPASREGEVPLPSAFLVGRDGVVRYATRPQDVGGTMRTRSVLAALDAPAA